MTDTDTRRRSRQPEADCRAISERLVERLRTNAAAFNSVGLGHVSDVSHDSAARAAKTCLEAADRIEALEAARRTSLVLAALLLEAVQNAWCDAVILTAHPDPTRFRRAADDLIDWRKRAAAALNDMEKSE